MKAKYDFFIFYISTFNEVVISVLLLWHNVGSINITLSRI
jgi:hypothetical protein